MNDVAVIGGGPAGSRAAALLARDHDVVVVEEHPRPGLPMQCAGLVTDEVVKLSGVRPDVLSTILGAEVVFPDGSALTVRSDRPIARAIDRTDLDSKLADSAVAAGAEFMTSTKYRSHSVSDSVRIDTSSGEVRSRLIVGADGHSSKVAASIPDNAPREYLRGIQADVAVRMEHQDMFRVRLGHDLAPGFFTWEIPCGDYTRVGLCTSWSAGPPMDHLRKLLSINGYEDKVIGMHSGKIPVGGRRRIVSDRLMLIGDAACQVKPVSGGGLFPGLTAAPLLAEKASEALESDDLSGRNLGGYAIKCEKAFGSELRNGYRLRRMFVRMSDDDLDAAGRFASRDDVRILLDGIDIDHPSKVVGGLLRHPGAMFAAVPVIMRCLV